MSEANLQVAMIGGLGIMASPMARHWKSGGPLQVVRVHDRGNPGEKRDKARKGWKAHGAMLTDSYETLVGQGDLDGVMVCAGKNGDDLSIIAEVAHRLKATGKSSFLCHMSTVSAGFAQTAFEFCRKLGVVYVNYPLTGGAIGAEKGTVLVLASGDRGVYDRLLPALTCLGTPRYFGERVAAGAEVKFMGHMMVFNGLVGISSANAVYAECFQAGEFGGAEQTSFFDFLNGGAGGTRQWDLVLKFAAQNNDWGSGFLLKYGVVDAIYTAELCLQKGVSELCAEAVLQVGLGFSYVLNQSSESLSTQGIARAMLSGNAKEMDAFIKKHSVGRGEVRAGLSKCIASLPEGIRKSVRLEVAEADFK